MYPFWTVPRSLQIFSHHHLTPWCFSLIFSTTFFGSKPGDPPLPPTFKHAKVGRIWDAICVFIESHLENTGASEPKKGAWFSMDKKTLWVYGWGRKMLKNNINLDV